MGSTGGAGIRDFLVGPNIYPACCKGSMHGAAVGSTSMSLPLGNQAICTSDPGKLGLSRNYIATSFIELLSRALSHACRPCRTSFPHVGFHKCPRSLLVPIPPDSRVHPPDLSQRHHISLPGTTRHFVIWRTRCSDRGPARSMGSLSDSRSRLE